MICARRLTYTYPDALTPAIAAIDLEIEEGSFVVFAGASGSGKSTLVRALTGLVPHFHGGTFAGTVTVDGRDTRVTPPRDLAGIVGFVDQRPEGQAVTDVVEDEITFGMENLGIDPTTMRTRLEETLDQVGIAHLRTRRIATLSGGERQRVQIAAALALHPKILVLDEPTSQLDPGAAEDVFASLQRLHADLGLTLIVTEHRLDRVLQHAERLIVLRAGEMVADGAPAEVLGSGVAVTPLSRLARGLGWERVPMTIREGRALVRTISLAPAGTTVETPGEVVLDARGVRVALGGSEVLRDVDLSACRGEVVAIVGRNGAGKTTLLRAALGLTRARAGSITLAGRDVERTPVATLAQHAAYVPQDAGTILFRRTVHDEIATTVAARGGDVDDVLLAHDLVTVRNLDPRDLSHGMRLRVALAAATASARDLIALDEPTRGVDADAKARLAAMIAGWRDRAVLLVTHDVELIASCATRVVFLAEGAVVVDGPMHDVLGGSSLFSSQMHKVFGDRRIATVEDALAAAR